MPTRAFEVRRMLRLRGQEPIAHSAQLLAARLADAAWLVAALPDTLLAEGNADRARCRSQVRDGLLSGTLDSVAQVVDRAEFGVVRYRVVTEGAGGSGVVLAELRFEPHGPDRTLVHWQAELTEVGGLLRFAPASLLRGAAERLIPEVWDAIGRRLATLSEPEA